MCSRTRILLVDDHSGVRTAIARALELEPDFAVVGQAADGWDAIEQVEQLMPDVVVMDVTMPRMNGLEATRILSAAVPEVKVIGLSLHEVDLMADSMLSAGATAYVAKSASPDDLVAAVRSAGGREMPTGGA